MFIKNNRIHKLCKTKMTKRPLPNPKIETRNVIEDMDVENKMNEGTDKETFEHHRFKVDPNQTPVRIDKFLYDRLFQVSRSKIQAAIKEGAVLVDDLEVKPNYKVRPNDLITINFDYAPREPQPIQPEDIPLDIVYEDDELLILNKAVGMAVHPGIGNRSGTLVNALAFHLQDNARPVKEGNAIDRPYLVHRIDKDTSGLLVVAKTDLAMNGLAKQFFDHSIERKYNAIIWGEFKEDEGTITGNIGRDPSNRMKQFVFPNGEVGKHAITHYRVLERMYYISLVECQLETGRTHQIRVHMKYKGHPLFNDAKYSGDTVVKGTVFDKYRQFVYNCFDLIPRHALHAKSLGFIHPKTGERMFFDSELPEDFQNVLTKWRNYINSRKGKLK